MVAILLSPGYPRWFVVPWISRSTSIKKKKSEPFNAKVRLPCFSFSSLSCLILHNPLGSGLPKLSIPAHVYSVMTATS